MLKEQVIKKRMLIANVNNFVFLLDIFESIENIKWELPKTSINKGRYKYLSLAKQYVGDISCKNGNSVMKKKEIVVKKK